MSDLILPTHMAKARKKEKIKVAEEGKTIEELEKNQKKVEEIEDEIKEILKKGEQNDEWFNITHAHG